MWRIWAPFFFLVLLYSAIVVRLFYWQVVAGDALKRQATAQHYVEFELPANRGEIQISDGTPIVMNEPAYLVYAQPQEIQNIQTFAQKVNECLALGDKDLIDKLSSPGKLWVPIAHKVDEQTTEKLKNLGLKGLGFEKEPKRYYPEASMSAHLLGFVGSDENGKDKGYFGLEGYYNRELQGKSGVVRLERNVQGTPILVGQEIRIEPEHGRSLRLWLDRSIQFIAERHLYNGILKYGAKEGSVVVMDPKTGGILALATYPTYEPQKYSQFESALYPNPVFSAGYEPGSTFKVLVMSATLEEKKVKPSTEVPENGPVNIGDYTIRTWNNKYHGQISATQILEYSSNVGMVFIAQKLGLEKLLSYIHNFGFGELTLVDAEEESTSSLRKDAEWSEIDLATASFGQGIAVTPIQMVRAVGALANDGWLMEPHIVREICDEKKKCILIEPKRSRRVVSKATAKVITEMMVSAVEKGESKWAKPKGYRIAGKTGTAQIPVSGHYDEDKTIASFIGFTPADNPVFVMLVTLREPTSSPWGSETAAPLFYTIAKDILAHYGIPPQ